MMNGVTPVARKDEAACDSLREQWGVNRDSFVVGILARIEPYKGHLHILEALDMLTKQGRDVQLLIAGLGDFEPELRKHVARLGLEERVRFLGFQTDVAGFLSVLDLQLNASYGTETSSLSILEGLSMGLPAVVSTYGGNPWLIDDGQDGLLFENRNSEHLAQCIAKLMDEPDSLAAMRQKAVEIFNQRFTAKIFAQNIEKVYDTAMVGKHHE